MINTLQQFNYDTLKIDLETKTGDKIKFNFESTKVSNTDLLDPKNFYKATINEFDFSSTTTNGLDENDIKEIENIMKEAKPLIDNFLNEQFTTIDSIKTHNMVNDITSMLLPSKSTNQEKNNLIKEKLIQNFDESIKSQYIEDSNKTNSSAEMESMKKLLEEIQKLIKQIFDKLEKDQETREKYLDNYNEKSKVQESSQNNINTFLDKYV